jgi:hypothetical protein
VSCPALERILADNDPRNGTVAQRLIRMSEQPDREPYENGLYPDAPAPCGACEGSGRIPSWRRPSTHLEPCSDCDGTGESTVEREEERASR